MVPPAEKPKTLINIYPRSMPHEAPVPVPIYSDLQLERMSETGLKLVTSKLYDSITETGVLDLPPLLPSSQSEVVIKWILDVQVALAKTAGLDVTPASFGVGSERPSV